MTFTCADFKAGETIASRDGTSKSTSSARIYFGSTLITMISSNAENSSSKSTTVDISGYNSTYTIYASYYNMDGNSKADQCTLKFTS